MCEICSHVKKNKDQNNITVNTVLVPLWLTLISFKYYPGVSIVNFEQANVSYIISSLSTAYNKHLQAWFLLKLSFNCYVQKCIFQICSPEVTYSSKKHLRIGVVLCHKLKQLNVTGSHSWKARFIKSAVIVITRQYKSFI